MDQRTSSRQRAGSTPSLTLGRRWVRRILSSFPRPKLLRLNAFREGDPCLRNDGVTGSSPVSGTSLSIGNLRRAYAKCANPWSRAWVGFGCPTELFGLGLLKVLSPEPGSVLFWLPGSGRDRTVRLKTCSTSSGRSTYCRRPLRFCRIMGPLSLVVMLLGQIRSHDEGCNPIFSAEQNQRHKTREHRSGRYAADPEPIEGESANQIAPDDAELLSLTRPRRQGVCRCGAAGSRIARAGDSGP